MGAVMQGHEYLGMTEEPHHVVTWTAYDPESEVENHGTYLVAVSAVPNDDNQTIKNAVAERLWARGYTGTYEMVITSKAQGAKEK